jgi:dipeptidyl aminopeptidase/acylaminoacyl peptidase
MGAARAGAVALACALTGVAAAAKPPVEAFAALPAMRSAGLSPDGKHFAAIQETGGRPVVAIYTVGSSSAPISLPSDDWVIRGVRWASNDYLVIIGGKGDRLPGGRDLWTVNRSIAVRTDGSNPVRLLDNIDELEYNSSAAAIVNLGIDDPAHIYMPLFNESARGSFTLDVFKVDLATGRGDRFARGSEDTSDWVMDGHGNVVARVEDVRKPKSQRVELPDGRSWRALFSAPVTVDSGLGLIGLTQDGEGLVRQTQAGGREVLTRIDLATGKETLLYSNPTYDVAGAITDAWTGRVIGAGYDAEGSVGTYFDPVKQKFQSALEQSFAGLAVSQVSYDLNYARLIVAVSGPRHPPTYHFVDRSAKTMGLIMASYPGLSEADLGEMKPYDYAARDGLRIPAFITLPPGKTPRNLPAIVMPHGGPDARDSLGFDWWAQFLANRGYVVLQPNYRGSAGYGRAFTEAGFQQWGLKMQDDITDGVMKMIADGIADPKRICIVGASYGGYATLAGATLTPDLYACAASVAGVSDLPEIIKWSRKLNGEAARDFWVSRIGSPSDDSERLRATSPARQARNAKCPILLMHGALDTTVPIRQSRLMEDALKDAGKPVSFVELKGDDHYLQLGSTRLQMLTELETFLEAHIGH